MGSGQGPPCPSEHPRLAFLFFLASWAEGAGALLELQEKRECAFQVSLRRPGQGFYPWLGDKAERCATPGKEGRGSVGRAPSRRSPLPVCFKVVDFTGLPARPSSSLHPPPCALLEPGALQLPVGIPSMVSAPSGLLSSSRAGPARLGSHRHLVVSIPLQPEWPPARGWFSRDPELYCPQSLP